MWWLIYLGEGALFFSLSLYTRHLFGTHWMHPPRSFCPMNSPGLSIIWRAVISPVTFLTQGSNPAFFALAGEFFTIEPFRKPQGQWLTSNSKLGRCTPPHRRTGSRMNFCQKRENKPISDQLLNLRNLQGVQGAEGYVVLYQTGAISKNPNCGKLIEPRPSFLQ